MGDIGQMGAAGISAAANLAATSATNSANVSMNNATNETSRQIANENNQTQIAMQRENNQFNHNEAELANQRMIEQWERESRYNSPIEQIKRLEAAGLNPQLAYGGSSVNNVGATSHGGSQASAGSSGISPSMPVLRPGHIDPYLPGSDFANLAKAFADAKKTGAEGDLAIRGMNYALRNMKANAELADMASTFERIYGGAMRDKKLALLGEDVLLKTEELYNLKKEGKLTEAKTLLTEIQQTTEKMEGRLKKFLGDTEEQRSKTFMSKLRADINLENAQANSANSSAHYTNEQLGQLKDMREFNIDLRRNAAQMSRADLMKQGATLYQEIDYLLGHFEALSEADKAELRKVKAEADQMEWNYNMRWVNFALDTAERINNGITNWIPFAPDKTTTTHSENVVHSDGSWRQRDVVESSKKSKGW